MRLVDSFPESPTRINTQPAFQHRFDLLLEQIASVVVTSRHNIRMALVGLFAQGHLLLEDLPGVGKTLLAKTIAGSIEGKFTRIQFTPDLLPSDITGTSVFDARKQSFEFIPGPIFANVVVADELNRTGPRTQSALLEAMAEGAVSADSNIWSLPQPFFIVATQNLIETYGTFPLPNSQLDRFMISMTLGMPSSEQELEILSRSEEGTVQLSPVLTRPEVVKMQDAAAEVELSTPVREYIVNLAAATRESSNIAVGVSPRGSTSLLKACKVWAASDGRTFVAPEDVQQLVPHVWAHRIMAGLDQDISSGREAISELLRSVPVPL